MKKLTAKNNGVEYYTLGMIKGRANTLLVQPVIGCSNDVMMFCEAHQFAYQIKGSCSECRNAVREQPADGSVTARDTGLE
jgi:hypothetical protein